MAVTEPGPTSALIARRYRLVERIGSGAMGEVWLAHDERLDRAVAVKKLLPGTGLDEAEARRATERALREARNAARLQHPHAVVVHDVVEHDGRPCLVMEYVPARSLSAVVRVEGVLPPQRVARIGQQVAAALAAAHEAGIAHRDVKPDNVLLTDDVGAKITDFGISRAVGDSSVTGPGLIVGTPAFLSPEVATGGSGGYASDVFSLGATLYAAVEGAPPFGFNDNTIVVLQAVASGRVPPPVHAGPLGPVLLWMLRTDPAQRPTMAEVADALDAVAEGRTVTPPVPTTPMAAPSPRRRRTVVATLTAVGLLTVGLVAGVLISDHGGRAPAGALDLPRTAHTRGVPTPATPTDTGSSCVADYAVTNAWPGGYQAQVTVRNPGGDTVRGWTVTLGLPDGQTITQLWNGALSRQGTSVTVANLDYNATMSSNGSTTFGFLGGVSGADAATPVLHCTAHR
jgi:tRNA A-37 threonylcarbamoyl transferase component Bud32